MPVDGLRARARTSRADAGIWTWGCQGQLSNQQIIFNGRSMYLVDSNKPFGDVHKLKNDNIDALVTGGASRLSRSSTMRD